jgi:hypothetical protein
MPKKPEYRPSPLIVAGTVDDLLMIVRVRGQAQVKSNDDRYPPCFCCKIVVDPEGRTIVNEGGENEQVDDSCLIRWMDSAHADLRVHKGLSVGEMLQAFIFSDPSSRSLTLIITDTAAAADSDLLATNDVASGTP